MRKFAEIAIPSSCFNRARDDEPMFILLGRDKASVVAVRAWIEERVRSGKNTRDDLEIRDAEAWINMVNVDHIVAERNKGVLPSEE